MNVWRYGCVDGWVLRWMDAPWLFKGSWEGKNILQYDALREISPQDGAPKFLNLWLLNIFFTSQTVLISLCINSSYN